MLSVLPSESHKGAVTADGETVVVRRRWLSRGVLVGRSMARKFHSNNGGSMKRLHWVRLCISQNSPCIESVSQSVVLGLDSSQG